MQVQAELPIEFLVGQFEAVPMASFFQKCHVQLMVLAREHMPRHFNVAVGWHVDGRGRSYLTEGETECPTTEDIPLADTGSRFKTNQLVAGLRRKSYLFDAHVFRLRPLEEGVCQK
jgi:hypothetical protein